VWLVVGLLAVLSVGACWRRGTPIIDTAPRPAEANGTISGSVSGPAGTSAIAGRTIEAVNVDTGERQRETTSTTGGYTFKLKPGKYRLELTLLEGETIIKQPGVIDLNKSDVDSDRDIVVGVVRISHPSYPQLRSDPAMGTPIA
jgi:hypothetical protein